MDNTVKRLGLLSAAALLLLSPAPADAAPPDLCDELILNATGEVYRDSTGAGISRWCEPRTDPPTWDAPVCCVVTDEANCVPTNSRGRCDAGMAFWCDYGERIGDGVACYQPLPSACDFGGCLEPPAGVPLEQSTPLCCMAGGCWALDFEEYCGGWFSFCEAPYTKEDGTVGCGDDD